MLLRDTNMLLPPCNRTLNMQVEELITPALIVDESALTRNIERMARRAREFNVDLRPHIKTHKCVEIAELQRSHGAKGITVATVYEAKVFAEAGFDDITLAMPLAHDKFPIIKELAQQTRLKVLVDHPITVTRLDTFCKQENLRLDVLMKVDVGYHRCGVRADDPAAIGLAEKIADSTFLKFEGILTHGGHTYSAKTIEEVQEAAHEEQERMVKLAQRLREHNKDLSPETVSIGSTPGMSLTTELMEGITEVRPGNYVFHDYEQVALGACKIEDCALQVLASVIGVYEDRMVIDAGATTLSVDPGPRHIEPFCGYGKVLSEDGTPMSGVRIESLSQEHGKIMFIDGGPTIDFEPGMKIKIVPNHSCLTANLADAYHVLENGRITKVWKIHRGRIRNSL